MRLKIFILSFLLSTSCIFSETEFSGKVEVSLMALVPEGDYTTPTNPSNVYGFKDFSMSPSLVFDISNYDDLTNFEAKFSLGSYPIGYTFKNLSPQDDETQKLLDSYFETTGESINTFELERLFLDIQLIDNLAFSIGRKPYLLGYGYGWNPTDNINPLKNPEDPNAELKGVDSVSLNMDLGVSTIRTILIVNKEIFTQGTSYEHLALAADINFYFDALDLILTGYYNFSNERTEKVNSLALGFKKDILGIGLYGEGIILDGTRNKFPDAGSANYKEDITFNLLGGIEYVFTTDTSAILEYYYNGEGFSKNDREAYNNLLKSSPTPLHRSSNYTEHYLLLNLSQPFYNLNSTGNLAAIYSIDSTCLTVSPSYEISFSENTNIKLTYSGLFDFGSNDFTERDLSPIKNMFNLNISYVF